MLVLVNWNKNQKQKNEILTVDTFVPDELWEGGTSADETALEKTLNSSLPAPLL
jgi:hypothetical protein